MKAIVGAVLLAVGLAAAQGAFAEQTPPRPADAQGAQPIPFRKDEGFGAMVLNAGLGLAVAIGAAVGVLYLLRRHLAGGQNAPGRRLRVIETVRLGPKTTLFLVAVDDRNLLIGQQGDTLVALAQPSAPPGPPPGTEHAA